MLPRDSWQQGLLDQGKKGRSRFQVSPEAHLSLYPPALPLISRHNSESLELMTLEKCMQNLHLLVNLRKLLVPQERKQGGLTGGQFLWPLGSGPQIHESPDSLSPWESFSVTNIKTSGKISCHYWPTSETRSRSYLYSGALSH